MQRKLTLSAHCEFGHRWIVRLRRMSGLMGRTAAIDGGDKRLQWAGRSHRNKLPNSKKVRTAVLGSAPILSVHYSNRLIATFRSLLQRIVFS